MSCSVWQCKSHSSQKRSYHEEISFHRFPKNEDLQREWIKRIGRLKWECNINSRVCSKHFTSDSFVPNQIVRYRRLHAHALPSLHLPDMMVHIHSTMATIPDSAMETCVESSDHDQYLAHLCKIEIKEELDPLSGITDTIQHETISRWHKEQINKFTLSNIKLAPDLEPANEQERKKHTVTIESLSYIKQEHNYFADPASMQQGRKIGKLQRDIKITNLQREIEKVERVSRRRLRKINALTKRISRLEERKTELHCILYQSLDPSYS